MFALVELKNITQLRNPDIVEQTRLVVNIYIDSVLCFLGLVGNALILIVLSREKNTNSNIFLMKVLAGYDFLYLLHSVIYTVLRSSLQHAGLYSLYNQINPYVVTIDVPIAWIVQTGIIWTTVMLAVDRYWALSRPFQALTVCTVRNARIAAAVTTLLAILFNLIRFPYYHKIATVSLNNDTFVAHAKVDLHNWNDDLYRYLYHITLTFIFLYIIPITTLGVFNYLLIRVLRRAKYARARMSVTVTTSPTHRSANSTQKHNATVTLNMVIVISKFILCETPDFISAVLASINGVSMTDEYKVFNCLKEMLLISNSVLNFYIYCLFNGKFRDSLLVTCGCRKTPRRRNRLMSSGQLSCSSVNPSLPSANTSAANLPAMASKSTQTQPSTSE